MRPSVDIKKQESRKNQIKDLLTLVREKEIRRKGARLIDSQKPYKQTIRPPKGKTTFNLKENFIPYRPSLDRQSEYHRDQFGTLSNPKMILSSKGKNHYIYRVAIAFAFPHSEPYYTISLHLELSPRKTQLTLFGSAYRDNEGRLTVQKVKKGILKEGDLREMYGDALNEIGEKMNPASSQPSYWLLQVPRGKYQAHRSNISKSPKIAEQWKHLWGSVPLYGLAYLVPYANRNLKPPNNLTFLNDKKWADFLNSYFKEFGIKAQIVEKKASENPKNKRVDYLLAGDEINRVFVMEDYPRWNELTQEIDEHIRSQDKKKYIGNKQYRQQRDRREAQLQKRLDSCCQMIAADPSDLATRVRSQHVLPMSQRLVSFLEKKEPAFSVGSYFAIPTVGGSYKVGQVTGVDQYGHIKYKALSFEQNSHQEKTLYQSEGELIPIPSVEKIILDILQGKKIKGIKNWKLLLYSILNGSYSRSHTDIFFDTHLVFEERSWSDGKINLNKARYRRYSSPSKEGYEQSYVLHGLDKQMKRSAKKAGVQITGIDRAEFQKMDDQDIDQAMKRYRRDLAEIQLVRSLNKYKEMAKMKITKVAKLPQSLIDNALSSRNRKKVKNRPAIRVDLPIKFDCFDVDVSLYFIEMESRHHIHIQSLTKQRLPTKKYVGVISQAKVTVLPKRSQAEWLRLNCSYFMKRSWTYTNRFIQTITGERPNFELDHLFRVLSGISETFWS